MRWHLRHMPWREFARRAVVPVGFLCLVNAAAATSAGLLGPAVLAFAGCGVCLAVAVS